MVTIIMVNLGASHGGMIGDGTMVPGPMIGATIGEIKKVGLLILHTVLVGPKNRWNNKIKNLNLQTLMLIKFDKPLHFASPLS